MRVSDFFLHRTKLRDNAVFLCYCVLIISFFYISIIQVWYFDLTIIAFILLLSIQFYFSAYLLFPILSKTLRISCYIIFFGFNYLMLREISIALLPGMITYKGIFEYQLLLTFLLTILGRNIRAYMALVNNLEKLNTLRTRNKLFGQHNEIDINFGNEGTLTVHPNEIVYIRTKSSGDHTKVFGLRIRKDKDHQEKLIEYETTAYQNFNEIFKELMSFPQFKRISQSTVINFQYPYEERNGSILIGSRRFAISPKFVGEDQLKTKNQR